jgi:hypothetical protein
VIAAAVPRGCPEWGGPLAGGVAEAARMQVVQKVAVFVAPHR